MIMCIYIYDMDIHKMRLVWLKKTTTSQRVTGMMRIGLGATFFYLIKRPNFSGELCSEIDLPMVDVQIGCRSPL